MKLKRHETGDETPTVVSAAPSAEAPDLEEVLAHLQAMRSVRQNIQGWIRRLAEQVDVAPPRKPSRYRCAPVSSGFRHWK